MKQARSLSEFSCLSEYTRLYPSILTMYLHTARLDISPVLLKSMDTHPESGIPLKNLIAGRLRMCRIGTLNKYRKIDVLMSTHVTRYILVTRIAF